MGVGVVVATLQAGHARARLRAQGDGLAAVVGARGALVAGAVIVSGPPLAAVVVCEFGPVGTDALEVGFQRCGVEYGPP
jgi:hypothetical protein